MAPAGFEMDPLAVLEIRRHLPSSTKLLRACLRCRQIMTKDQFVELGCPNCKDALGMRGSEGRVLACTTANYQGFVSLMRPGAFLSRFSGMANRRPGCYALTVYGTIPEHILNESNMEESDMEGQAARGANRSQPGSRQSQQQQRPAANVDVTSPAGSDPFGSDDDEPAVKTEVKTEGLALTDGGNLTPLAGAPMSAKPDPDFNSDDEALVPAKGTPSRHSAPGSVRSAPRSVHSGAAAAPLSVHTLSAPSAPGSVHSAPGSRQSVASDNSARKRLRRMDVQAGTDQLNLEPDDDAEFA